LQLDADHAQRYASDLGMLLGLRSESCDFQVRRLFRGHGNAASSLIVALCTTGFIWFQGSTFGLLIDFIGGFGFTVLV